jgi:hypothetical protein
MEAIVMRGMPGATSGSAPGGRCTFGDQPERRRFIGGTPSRLLVVSCGPRPRLVGQPAMTCGEQSPRSGAGGAVTGRLWPVLLKPVRLWGHGDDSCHLARRAKDLEAHVVTAISFYCWTTEYLKVIVDAVSKHSNRVTDGSPMNIPQQLSDEAISLEASTPAAPRKWARRAAVHGRIALRDLADSLDALLAPRAPQASAIVPSVLEAEKRRADGPEQMIGHPVTWQVRQSRWCPVCEQRASTSQGALCVMCEATRAAQV